MQMRDVVTNAADIFPISYELPAPDVLLTRSRTLAWQAVGVIHFLPPTKAQGRELRRGSFIAMGAGPATARSICPSAPVDAFPWWWVTSTVGSRASAAMCVRCDCRR